MRLVGSEWGAGAKTLRIAILSLVYSTAEYCAPVWCRSAHTRLIDSVLNDALCIVTGCLRPTPTDHLPVLSGIQPDELRQLGATLSLAYRGSLDPDHISYGLLSGSSDTGQVRLKSRRLFVPDARNLLDNLARLGIRAFVHGLIYLSFEEVSSPGQTQIGLGPRVYPFTTPGCCTA